MSLKDKTIVVTGGSRGLGVGVVEALVEQGAKVTVVARDGRARKRRSGLASPWRPADVTDEGAAQSHPRRGAPDILVLNAARRRDGPIGPTELGGLHRALETDVKAGLYWIQAALNLPLAPGSASSSAPAARPSTVRRFRRLRRRQAHALVDGQVRQWGRPGRRGSDPLPGDRAAADHRRAPALATTPPASTLQAAASTAEAFLARFGAPLPPRKFGDHCRGAWTIRNTRPVSPLVSRAIPGSRFWRKMLLEREAHRRRRPRVTLSLWRSPASSA